MELEIDKEWHLGFHLTLMCKVEANHHTLISLTFEVVMASISNIYVATSPTKICVFE